MFSQTFTSETLIKFYEAAFRLFERKEIDKAADAFFFLAAIKPDEHKFWYGLGLSEQYRSRFLQAIEAYAMASMTNIENPYPHFHAAICYHAVGDMQTALASIELALSYADKNSDYETLIQDATLIKAEIAKRLY